MNDRTFSMLEKLYNGMQISRAGQESSIEGLSTSERNLEAQAFQYIINEKFLVSPDPNNTNHNTKYAISDIGKKAYEKERDRRDNELRLLFENKAIESLQLKLLQANIQMAESAITANTAAQRNYEWQKANGNRTLVFIGISALMGIASLITTVKIQDTETPKLLKRQVQLMDSISTYYKEIDSTLKRAAKDSFYRRGS